jgi:hypothetical protein
VHFVVTTDNDAIFTDKPQFSPAGALSFTPKPNTAGTAHVTVTLMDDGGTDLNGKDTSDPQTFTIEVVKAHVWHNTLNALDVTGDTQVVPDDAVALLSFLNANGPKPVPQDGRAIGPYFDVSGDGLVAPEDVVDVLSFLNSFGANGEGEQGSGFRVLGSDSVQVAAEGEAPMARPAAPLAADNVVPLATDSPVQDDLLALLAADVSSQPKRRNL